MPPFVLLFFCLKTSIHPQNVYSSGHVIPGQDQGTSLNKLHNASNTNPSKPIKNKKYGIQAQYNDYRRCRFHRKPRS